MAIRVPLPAHDAERGAEGHEQAGAVAFEDLWQHRSALRDICQRIVGDAATADDVVQETYMRALRNLDRLEQRPSLMPWLATVARRRSIDELRRRQYQLPVDTMPDESTKPEVDPGEAAGVSETVSRVREALIGLTDRERELLMQQVNQGLTLAELAAYDNSSIASVRSVLSRARNKLRDALEEAGARVLAPVGLLGAWMKHRAGAMNARVQRLSPVLPGGYERVGEMATAAVAVAALAVGGGLAPALGGGDSHAPSAEVAISSVGSPGGAVELTIPDGFNGHTSAGTRSSGRDTASESLRRSTVVEPGPDASESDTGRAPDAPIEAGPLPDASPPRSVPGANPDYIATQNGPEGPGETHVHQLVAPRPAAASPSSYRPVFGLSRIPCGPTTCDVLWYSADGGATWAKRKAEELNGATSIMVPNDYSVEQDTVYASGPLGLLASFDGGEHFSQVYASPSAGPAVVSPRYWSGDQSVYLGGTPHSRYDEATGVAVPLATGLPAQVAHFAFGPDFPATDVMFAGTRTAGEDDWQAAVYRCQDGVCVDPVELPQVTQAPRLAVPSFSPDGSVVFAWSGSRLFRSVDGGDTFALVSLGVPGHIRAFADDGRAVYLAVEHVGATSSSGAVLRSLDHGATWTAFGAGTALAQGVDSLTAMADGTLLAGADTGGVLCSADTGVSWSSRCE